jgi:parallel beta-helix repeat protein
MRNEVTTLLIVLLLVVVGFFGFITLKPEIVSAATTLYVGGPGPGNYSEIQLAIDDAKDGDTVFVYGGIYYENVIVNKIINLTGEGSDTTTIHGGGVGDVVYVNADWVNITGFNLTGSGSEYGYSGIKVNNVTQCKVYNNKMILNQRNGIYLSPLSNNNTILGNNISLNGEFGILVRSSSNNIIKRNNISSNPRAGIDLVRSIGNNVIENNIINNGINVDGVSLQHYNSHYIPTNNIVNNKPVYYYKNASNINIDGIPVGNIILANCTRINLSNLQIYNTDAAVTIAYSSEIKVFNSNISNNLWNIFIESSSKLNITNNTIMNSKIRRLFPSHGYIPSGMLIRRLYNSTIQFNYLSEIQGEGITLIKSLNNNIIGNHIIGEAYIYNWGIYLSSIEITYDSNNNIISENNVSKWPFGISTYESSDNIITNNMALYNKYGIVIGSSSLRNKVANNNVSFNHNGITCSGSSYNNRIFHNNIIDNINQSFDIMNNNFWNISYPFGGNHWSDFDEPSEGVFDDYQGPDQVVLGGDGIVDNGTIEGGGKNPYMVDSDSQDYYPLMKPFQRSTPPLLPPILYINVSSDGKDIVLNWEPQTIQEFDPYLIYRSTDQTNFDFSTPWINTLIDKEPGELAPIPDRTTWNDTNAANPENSTNYNEQYYYVIRAFNGKGEISSTSRTVGKLTKAFPEGVSTFSLPLEPLWSLYTDYYTSSMNADYIKYIDPVNHTWRQHNILDGDTNNIQMKLGEGFEVKFDNHTNYTFTGFPGAMISYENNTGFEGFNYSSEGKNLTVSVESNGDVTLTWQEPSSMTFGDWYEIYYSNIRDGFYGTFGVDYDLAGPSIGFGTNSTIISGLGAIDPGARLYFIVVPFNASGVRGSSTYSLGIWTEEYLSQYDTFGIPLKLRLNKTMDWFCHNISDTVGMNYFIENQQRWGWHTTRMPQGAFDPILVMSEGYQISTSNATKFTFIGA